MPKGFKPSASTDIASPATDQDGFTDTDLVTPATSDTTSDNGAADPSPLFVEVDELPTAAQRGRERKYDALVDAAFAKPGRWFRINAEFKSAGQGAAMRKQYADERDEDGNVLHVKTAKVNGAIQIYVKVDQPAPGKDAPADANDDTADATV